MNVRSGPRFAAVAIILLFGLFLNTYEIRTVRDDAVGEMMEARNVTHEDNRATSSQIHLDTIRNVANDSKTTTNQWSRSNTDLREYATDGLRPPADSLSSTVTNESSQQPQHHNPDNHSTCFRTCLGGYPNRILVPNRQIKAGLGDRETVIQELGNVAAYLCAKLIIPIPALWLAEKHNNGTTVSDQLVWERDFVWAEHLPTHTLAASSDPRALLVPTEPESHPAKNVWRLGGPYKNKMVSSITRDFDRLENFTNQQQADLRDGKPLQQTFEWTIGRYFYNYWRHLRAYMVRNVHWENPTRRDRSLPISLCPGAASCDDPDSRHLLAGCQYVRLHPAKYIQETAQHIQTNLSRTFQTQSFGYLHLRRGDSQESCDTSPEKLQDYLNCTFWNATRGAAWRGIPLLVSSDDTSVEYRTEIQSIVETVTRMVFVDLDQVVHDAVQSQIDAAQVGSYTMNEFVIFKLVRAVAANARFQLERRRRIHCGHCDSDLIPTNLD